MRLNTNVIQRLCSDYCTLYKRRFEKEYDIKRESEFTRCKGMIGLVQDLIGAEIQTNIGDGLVGIRLVNPETGTVLGSASVPVEYKMKSVLGILFNGGYKKIVKDVYSRNERLIGKVEEYELECTSDYSVYAVNGVKRYEVTTYPGVKELFRVSERRVCCPVVAVSVPEGSSGFVFRPVRIYLK